MAVDRDRYHHRDRALAYWSGRHGAVWLLAWINTGHGRWAWIRWVEPDVANGVAQGGINIDLCVPEDTMRPKIGPRPEDYTGVKRIGGRGSRGTP